MSKVTLYVKDEQVIERAKILARKQGRSVSELVEEFLASLSAPPRKRAPVEGAPILRQLQAKLAGVHVDRSDYDKYLEKKYD